LPQPLSAVKEEVFSSLHIYKNQLHELNWPTVFTLPFWLETWWDHFGDGYRLMLRSIWIDKQLIGIVPLIISDSTARLLGCPNVCDYLDFVTLPGRGAQFFEILLSSLEKDGITRLELFAQHPEAAVFEGFFAGPGVKNWTGFYEQENETAELLLPADWEAYLAVLNKKQRHEVRRKIRKLEYEAGRFRFYQLDKVDRVINFIPDFFELFQQNREKDQFLTADMEGFFRDLITAAAEAGLARFGLLEIDDHIVAVVLYFDYQDRIYLYNSGYEREYAFLSVGLLSKIFCIRASIDEGKKIFDFLKGPEIYKSRLGGKAVPIYRVILSKI
jgi:hypothetical protein